MKKNTIIIFLFVSLRLFGQEDPRRVIAESFNVLKSKKQLTYNATLKFKFFDDDDSLKYTGNVYILKSAEDAIYKGKVWFSTNDSIYKFYDLNRIYVVNKNKKNVTTYIPDKNSMWPISGTIESDIVYKDFLDPAHLLKENNIENRLKLLQDTFICSEICYNISIKYPDTNGFVNGETKLYW